MAKPYTIPDFSLGLRPAVSFILSGSQHTGPKPNDCSGNRVEMSAGGSRPASYCGRP
jgi:hypothetical protein